MKPRQSGIPTPGKSNTPSRFRSASAAGQNAPPLPDDSFMSRAFADAIKANDPAQHRASDASFSSLSSLVPPSLSQSGRLSAAARPSSAASSSSTLSLSQSRSQKLPSARSASRQSDLFPRSASRTGRDFDVGDNVRIESLGYEGVLRYVGEIAGKPGIWAGVELGGGFYGKGKNNGSVNGKQYFTCPPHCGVFIAMEKLSPPTVGPGTLARPSSVASSRTGRTTPSVSGRITPSASYSSNGRATPSNLPRHGRVTPHSGRITPSFDGKRSMSGATPSARGKHNDPKGTAKNITTGSRASKYIGMTARQLNSRDGKTIQTSGESTPPHSSSPSPRTLSSPTRSPFVTPRPGGGSRLPSIGIGTPTTPSKGRVSYNTPRPRVPSAVAMPPPASPASSSRSITSNDLPSSDARTHETVHSDIDPTSTDLEVNGKLIQDKIAQILSGKITPSPASPRPHSSASLASSADVQNESNRSRLDLDMLLDENRELRLAAENARTLESEAMKRADALQSELASVNGRISELEGRYKTAERSLNERDSRIDSLERSLQQAAAESEKHNSEGESRTKDLQSRLDDSDILVRNLKEALEAKKGLENQNDAVLDAKNAEVALLQARVDKAYNDLADERKELLAQVDELREAGQETIALYEDRLSAADTQRYELEDKIILLEDRVRKETNTTGINSHHSAGSAAQIDSEILRDQVQHLQRKVNTLEDALEDLQMSSEREEATSRERIGRLKEKEESMKKELADGRAELDRLIKSEATARNRVEEIDEAFRESTFALENAQAEIEGLRTQLAASNLHDNENRSETSSDQAAGVAQGTALERARYIEEIEKLKGQLEETRESKRKVTEELDRARYASHTPIDLGQTGIGSERQASSENEREFDLRRVMEERSAELESLKKRYKRDQPVGVPSLMQGTSLSQSPSSKSDPATREEITGLKHIVQELQKENLVAAQRNKLLESENRLLMSETDQLRQELNAMEGGADKNSPREEQTFGNEHMIGVDVDLQRQLKDQMVKHENELDQLRKRLTDMEMKNARTVHGLNKEITELESLVESKIYREDELEQELERTKEKLARSMKKTSRGSTEPNEGKHGRGSAAEVCEICERPGHDIFNCSLINAASSKGSSKDLFCEDCESHGHVAEDCPHSLDVF